MRGGWIRNGVILLVVGIVVPYFSIWLPLLFLTTICLPIGVVVLILGCVVPAKKTAPAPAAKETVVEREVVTLVVCPYCGQKNPQGQARCSECGGTL